MGQPTRGARIAHGAVSSRMRRAAHADLAAPAFEAGRLALADTAQTNWTHWTPFSFPFNLTQQPAASIPCGFTSARLPVGLQIVAAKYQDGLVLRVARAFEAMCPIKLPTMSADGARHHTNAAPYQ